MFSFLLIFACGGDNNSLPTASDLYEAAESIVQTMVWDDAISACETQRAAALSEVHAMGKPRED